ncbi:uncharacterized protein LOC125070095 [Vanessa atalanta]|uniref:uncharacterized protein LOC125070095 n=1 Tax=Vanessa atalanta TaxID=42275 RepID=UPI001FCDC7A9|nr:uncharacterized protein LOC125070095 [Vanessa atalanta]
MKSNIWLNLWAKIKKFGLEYDDFPTTIENVSLLLRILTIDLYKKSDKRIPLIFHVMTAIAGLSFFYGYIFSMLWLVFFRYGLSNVKVVKRRATVIWVFLISDGAVYIIIPFVVPGRLFTVDIIVIYGLEPMLETPNYEIATFITTLSVGFAVYTMVSVAVYVIVIVGYNEAQLHALSEELLNVWDDSQYFYNNMKHRITDKVHAVYIRNKIINEFIRIRLRDIIKFHIANINLMREFDHDIRSTLAIEYTINTISIITELLGGLENTYLQLPYTAVHILMVCLAGQRIIDACDHFEKSVYSCKWENFNTSNRRTVYLMLIMSQKTLMLSAGGVVKLNFTCMMNILRSTYSTYTTLKSMVK